MTIEMRGVAARRRTLPASAKFANPDYTAGGERRARVAFRGYETLWFNTGTLCNITCENCYIESSPKNDRLVYLSRKEVKGYLREASGLAKKPSLIGFTGGEPFMNPEFIGMIEDSIQQGFRVLVLTNAMRPMQRHKAKLLELHRQFPRRLSLRVSLDHFERQEHEKIRGSRTWQSALDGLAWLGEHGFDISIAGRQLWNLDEQQMREGYRGLFGELGLDVDASSNADLILFPEMQNDNNTPEVTESCWKKLNLDPGDLMCASSRMIVKRKGAAQPAVVACTLIPYSKEFELGETLDAARSTVSLNHRHCSRFCVLGKASCRAD